MKNIKFFLLSLIAVTLLFSACSDLSKDTSGNQEKSEYTLLGSLSLAGVSRAAYSRTATSSFSDDLSWTITAKKGDKSYLPKEMSDTSFSFAFEETGEYTIEAKALKDGQAIAQGSTSCTVSKGGDNFAQIIAEPLAGTTPGSVNLVINLDTVAADNIASVYVEWQEPEFDRTAKALGFPMEAETADGAKTPELTSEVQAAMDAFNAWAARCDKGEFNKSFDVVNGKVTISFDDIFCGAHSVKLNFKDSMEDTLYSCTEVLNVYSGFTTDSWYGTSPYISVTQDGSANFVISDNFKSKYFNASIPIMLYTNNENTHNVSLFDNKTNNTINDISYEGDYYLSYCVDNSGYVYILYYTGAVGSNDSPVHIYSNNPVFNNETVTPVDADGGTLYLQYISYDSATNQIYGCYRKQNDYKDVVIVCFPNLVRSGSVETVTVYTKELTFNDAEFSLEAFCIYNNTGYTIKRYKNGYGTTTSVDLVKETLSGSAITDDYETYGNLELTSYGLISDMVCLDGYIYILANNTKPGFTEVSNYPHSGGIVRVKLETGDVENYLFSETARTDIEIQYEETNSEDEIEIKTETVEDIYQPDSINSTSGLFGPRKIIGIKPKKLVIADDGLFFYTDDEGQPKYKNVNRVVSVDLDSFEILNIDFPDETFEDDITEEIGLSTMYDYVTSFVCADE